jgi:hypothetical protein
LVGAWNRRRHGSRWASHPDGRWGLPPLEVKLIPKGLVKVNKSNVIGPMCVH